MMGLLLILTLSSVVAAVLGGLLRQGSNRMTFIVLSVAAPMGLMIALSLWQQIRRIGRR